MWSKKDDAFLSSNTDGLEDEESDVDEDSEDNDEDDAGEMKRKTEAHDNVDIEDESSDRDMAECRKISGLVPKRCAQEAAADPLHNEGEDRSWKQHKESNRRAQEGAGGPSSNEEDGSQKRRKETSRDHNNIIQTVLTPHGQEKW